MNSKFLSAAALGFMMTASAQAESFGDTLTSIFDNALASTLGYPTLTTDSIESSTQMTTKDKVVYVNALEDIAVYEATGEKTGVLPSLLKKTNSQIREETGRSLTDDELVVALQDRMGEWMDLR